MTGTFTCPDVISTRESLDALSAAHLTFCTSQRVSRRGLEGIRSKVCSYAKAPHPVRRHTGEITSLFSHYSRERSEYLD